LIAKRAKELVLPYAIKSLITKRAVEQELHGLKSLQEVKGIIFWDEVLRPGTT
jgi:hypothetical protein